MISTHILFVQITEVPWRTNHPFYLYYVYLCLYVKPFTILLSNVARHSYFTPTSSHVWPLSLFLKKLLLRDFNSRFLLIGSIHFSSLFSYYISLALHSFSNRKKSLTLFKSNQPFNTRTQTIPASLSVLDLIRLERSVKYKVRLTSPCGDFHRLVHIYIKLYYWDGH